MALKLDKKGMMVDIESLQYNWNIINLAYELWKSEIIESHNGMSIQLDKMVGVGENYIPKLCNGKVKKTKRVFNCTVEEVEILNLLQGKNKIIFSNRIEPEVREYIVINNLYKTLIGAGKHNKDASEEKDKLIQLCDGKDYKAYIKKLKESILNKLSKEQIKKKGAEVETFEYTHIGLIKRFLLGKNIGSSVIILGEQEEYIKRVVELLLEIKTDKLSKFNKDNLERLSSFVKELDDRVMAEVNYRRVKEYENKLSLDVVKVYCDMEEEAYKKRCKQEDLDWEKNF